MEEGDSKPDLELSRTSKPEPANKVKTLKTETPDGKRY